MTRTLVDKPCGNREASNGEVVGFVSLVHEREEAGIQTDRGAIAFSPCGIRPPIPTGRLAGKR